MIDLFFCSITDSDDLRAGMAELCQQRWFQVEGVRHWFLDDEYLNCSKEGFQRMRRIHADQVSESDVYIVADDDCLLPPSFDLDECVRIFKASGFSTLSLMPSNCTLNEWTPEKYVTENTPDVMEHVSAGHIRFCRKGHLKYWPPMETLYPAYDRIHAEGIRKEGGRVGYFRNHKQLHLGEGYSTVWNLNKVAVA